MLQLFDVSKSYTTADFRQVALDEVSLAFRGSEFVAVLGPSGSGKTTLLNIVGGLDQYDSGDLVIDGVSTKDYRDRDWDTYRNNRIGFVFQSYNLIPHQTVLANVELALTLTGVSPPERRERALAALAEVGLEEHVHKKPNQLSGGQMQRVAIARALINDPEILLADEPTGALDSATSLQIMGLLTQIAQDRLVIMVTHNPELAEQYATRTINLLDGKVADDSDPYSPEETPDHAVRGRVKRTSMSLLTALLLSFNNLMTKKGRTLMTAFAGSIGIIGIAAILALANGVNSYIKRVEEDTLSVYPLSIYSQGFDMTSLLVASTEMTDGEGRAEVSGGDVQEIGMLSRMFSAVGSNDLAALKRFINETGALDEYVNTIQYSYDVTPQIFAAKTAGGVRQVNPDNTFSTLGFAPDVAEGSPIAMAMTPNIFSEMLDDTSVIESQYQVVAGRWPDSFDEAVVVLTPSGGISDFAAYTLGLRDPAELDTMVKQLVAGDRVDTPTGTNSFSFDQILAVSFKVVNSADYYVFDPEHGVWLNKSGDKEFLRTLVDGGQKLRIVGVLQPESGATATALQPGIYYTSALTKHLIDQAGTTEIVRKQLADPGVNVFTGRTFADEEANPDGGNFDLASLVTIDEAAIANAFTFDESLLSLDTSFLNLSMPNLAVDPAALPQLDLSKLESALDFSGLQLGGLQLEGLDLSGINVDVDQAKMAQLSVELLEGYFQFVAANNLDPLNTAENFQLFLESAEGKAITTSIEAELTPAFTDAAEQVEQQVGQQIQTQVEQQIRTQLVPQLQGTLQAALTQYMQQAMAAYGQQVGSQLAGSVEAQISTAMEVAMSQLAANMSDAMGIDEAAFMAAFNFNLNEEELTELLMTMMSSKTNSFDGNLRKLGFADLTKPSAIDIYPIDFEAKNQVIAVLDEYNAMMKAEGEEDKVITYTDIVGALMSSVTDIINVISYVLVAFVSISLVVSSIMIGVITYISVLERKKEIGILRSIGASKRDIRRVFNAETLLVGFVAGVLGITITFLLTLPTNIIVEHRFGISGVAQLPWAAAGILVAISMALTFLAGIIPSSAAARKDPVEALRSE